LDKDTSLHEKYLISLINEEIDKIRDKISDGYSFESTKEILENIVYEIENKTTYSLKNIINGTGIVLHTGFGRAPFSGKTFREISNRLDGYVNLEFNLVSGKRGDRQDHLRKHISSICNSESAIVVNNNAGAVMLSINEIANNGEVIVSRGQLVEIGGSFRVPEIIEKSGARLKELQIERI
jgi:L-seryl-tRNA(Ser) seleniumtransferase